MLNTSILFAIEFFIHYFPLVLMLAGLGGIVGSFAFLVYDNKDILKARKKRRGFTNI